MIKFEVTSWYENEKKKDPNKTKFIEKYLFWSKWLFKNNTFPTTWKGLPLFAVGYIVTIINSRAQKDCLMRGTMKSQLLRGNISSPISPQCDLFIYLKKSFHITVGPKFIFAWDKQEYPPCPTHLLTPRNTQGELSRRVLFIPDCNAFSESCCREIPIETQTEQLGRISALTSWSGGS